jgi:hypothetical protein
LMILEVQKRWKMFTKLMILLLALMTFLHILLVVTYVKEV